MTGKLVLVAAFLLGVSGAVAQDIPASPIPLAQTDPLTALGPAGGPSPVQAATPPAARTVNTPPAAAPAPPLQMGQAVQVEDEPGSWDPCTVTQVFQGAYEVMCNYARKIVRDTKVRRPGGQPAAASAAVPASGPPFARGAIVEASPLSLPDRWQLCIVAANRLAQSGSYELICAGARMNVGPQWVRGDSNAP